MIAALAAVLVAADARAAIDAAHADLGRGFSTRDLASWERILDPDLKVWWAGEARYDKRGWLKVARDELALFQDPLDARITTLAVEAEGADVLSVTREVTCFRMPDKTKALRTLCYDQTYRERWRHGAQGWRVMEIRYSGQMSETLDGKPVTRAELQALGL